MTTPRISAAQIVLRQIDDLKPRPDNPRKHTARQIAQLAKSIAAFGFNNPLLLDRGNVVIAGEARRQAAIRLGWREVPTISLEHLTVQQIRAYRIADNALSDQSSWDDSLLAENLTILSAADLDFDLDAIGFDMPEIEFRVSGAVEEVSESVELPGNHEVPVSALGDVWQLGGKENVLAMHPTVKPTTLIADALRDSTDPGHAVLDPFLGSGSTLLAAQRTGRVAFGIEIDPLYIDVAIKRWQQLTGLDATLVGDGRTASRKLR